MDPALITENVPQASMFVNAPQANQYGLYLNTGAAVNSSVLHILASTYGCSNLTILNTF